MYQVGITGGIGSGKTLVCSVLNVLGIPVYHADMEARRIMNEDPVLKASIEGLLGKEAYRDGMLDRRLVGNMVFGNRNLLEQLNKLVHPVVREDYCKWVSGWSDVPYVVEEAAILFESGANRMIDKTVLVYAPYELRIKRVMNRDSVTAENVKKRMMHQMDEEQKRMLADEIIVNDDCQMLVPQVVSLHEGILKSKV
ncbi:MAG: dephospho-CoA kinase [Bacteroidota bacterium]